MSTIGDQLAYYFSITNRTRIRRGQQKLTPGEWMMVVYPNRYKNEATADRAFRDTVKMRRPGTELAEQAKVRHTVKHRSKRVQAGGVQEGQWNVVVHYTEEDTSGNTVERTRSFNAVSIEHTTLIAVPYLEALILPVAEEKLDEWCSEYGGENCTIDYIEVWPISTYTKGPVDFDEVYR